MEMFHWSCCFTGHVTGLPTLGQSMAGKVVIIMALVMLIELCVLVTLETLLYVREKWFDAYLTSVKPDEKIMTTLADTLKKADGIVRSVQYIEEYADDVAEWSDDVAMIGDKIASLPGDTLDNGESSPIVVGHNIRVISGNLRVVVEMIKEIDRDMERLAHDATDIVQSLKSMADLMGEDADHLYNMVGTLNSLVESALDWLSDYMQTVLERYWNQADTFGLFIIHVCHVAVSCGRLSHDTVGDVADILRSIERYRSTTFHNRVSIGSASGVPNNIKAEARLLADTLEQSRQIIIRNFIVDQEYFFNKDPVTTDAVAVETVGAMEVHPWPASSS